MSKIRIGIIGAGQIAKNHLQGYAKSVPEAELVALCDAFAPDLAETAAQYGIADTYTDFEELLAREDIDAVDVCLHNNLHMPVTVAGLRAGKHVYCEKPMAGSYRDALTMLETARETGKKLHIQLSTLYSQETRAAKLLIDGGHLGQLYHARSTGHRRRGRPFVDGYGREGFVQKEVAAGGAMYDMGVYHISQMLYLLGSPAVERVSGKTYQEMDMHAGRRESSGYNVEELGLGLVKFAGGVTLDIIESWAINLNPFEGSCVVGAQGGIRLDPFGYFTTLEDMNLDATLDLENASFRWHQLGENAEAYDSSQQHWVAALQGKVPLLPTAELALETMLISEAIYLSNALGREVTAEEVLAQSKSTAIEARVK